MRILMIAPEPFFEPRGTPFSEFHRIRALTALGHTVDLVTYPFGEDVTMAGLRVFRAIRPLSPQDLVRGQYAGAASTFAVPRGAPGAPSSPSDAGEASPQISDEQIRELMRRVQAGGAAQSVKQPASSAFAGFSTGS